MSLNDDPAATTVKENNNIQVYLRLRPINKLEASRRSKNCVELWDDDPTSLTVDSHLEGEYEFSFDRVFGEKASQIEVFEYAVAPTVMRALDGYNCTFIAFGQTGGGKTHTMMGVGGCGGAVPMEKMGKRNTRGSRLIQGDAASGPSEISKQPSMVNGEILPDPQREGMIQRTVKFLFSIMEQPESNMEYTVRCSYVEIYLEKVLDLLSPGGVHGDGSVSLFVDDAPADEAAGFADNASTVQIVGATEICCTDKSDVLSLLARGNSCRTISSTELNTDSSRSHAIFIIKIERRNIETGETKKSTLQLVDLAGSEMAKLQQNQLDTNQTESKMINRSLAALTNLVRTEARSQMSSDLQTRTTNRSNLPKLAQFLRPCFGGNCLTTILLVASPSSYNIGESISTMRFGQICRQIQNFPVLNTELSSALYRKQLSECEKERNKLEILVKELAAECQFLKSEGKDGPINQEYHAGPLWDHINEVLTADEINRQESNEFQHQKDESRQASGDERDDDAQHLREELNSTTKALTKAETTIEELKSEIAVLRSQNKKMSEDKEKAAIDLNKAKKEVQNLSQRKTEVEHNLRTSQFRENEATVFLRQFRRFYRRLLKNKGAQGNGSTKEITSETPGVPELTDLIDIDMLLLESGLIEEDEIHDETAQAPNNYVPSKAALLRSTAAAKNAAREEGALPKGLGGVTLNNQGGGDAVSSGAVSESEYASEDGSSSYTYVTSSSVTTNQRIGSSLDLAGGGAQSMATISEMGDGGISQYAPSGMHKLDHKTNGNADDLSGIGERREEDTYKSVSEVSRNNTLQNEQAADADAGAGIAPIDQSEDNHSNPILSFNKRADPAIVTDERQRLLQTPAGRYAIMREKDLERDLLKMTERCIELQIALNEEKETVDALSNKPGTMGKKKLAQEAITLRQQLERKTHDLQAIIWKMNELHLINKTYNDKMSNREQHVVYLEKKLVEMQGKNGELISAKQESEKKLREELESLRAQVDGITLPLWQFGDRESEVGFDKRKLPHRIVLPVIGGEYRSSLEMGSPKRKMSTGEIEPNFHEDNEEERDDDGLVNTSSMLTQEEETSLMERDSAGVQIAEATPVDACETRAKIVDIETSNTETQTDNVEVSDVQTQTEEKMETQLDKVPSVDRTEIGTQTDEIQSDGLSAGAIIAGGVAGATVGVVGGMALANQNTEEENGQCTNDAPIQDVGNDAALNRSIPTDDVTEEEYERLKREAAEESERLKALARLATEETETLKVKLEDARLVSEETARLKEENERLRIELEDSLLATENLRNNAEDARLVAEGELEEKVAKVKAEELRLVAAETERLQAELDDARLTTEQLKAEAEAARLAAEEEAEIRAAAEAETARVIAEAEEERRLAAEAEEERRTVLEEEAAARLKVEEEKRIVAEEEAARLKAEDNARQAAEEEAALLKAEEEAQRAAEEEAARLKAAAEEEERLRSIYAAEQEAFRLKVEEEARLRKVKEEEEREAKEKEERERMIAAEQEEVERLIRMKEEEQARLKAEEEGARLAKAEAAAKEEAIRREKAREMEYTKKQEMELLFVGGKLSNFKPRRSVKKLGPKIRAGIMKQNNKKSTTTTTDGTEASKKSKKSSSSSTKKSLKSKKKKKKKSTTATTGTASPSIQVSAAEGSSIVSSSTGMKSSIASSSKNSKDKKTTKKEKKKKKTKKSLLDYDDDDIEEEKKRGRRSASVSAKRNNNIRNDERVRLVGKSIPPTNRF